MAPIPSHHKNYKSKEALKTGYSNKKNAKPFT